MKEQWYKDIFARVLSMTDDGFIVVNTSGVIIDINDKYCDFLGKERKDIIGQNIQSIIPNYICLFNYLFISSQMSAKPYFIGSTGILLLW
ncbi:TPA: PAS domain S-box protein [Clostridioides difficile]